MRRIAAVALAGLLLAGCGSTGHVSSKQVIDLFQKRTGNLLVRDSKLEGPTWEVLDLDQADDPGYRYGVFTLYVVKKGESGSTLLQGNDDKPLKADDRGIYWQRNHGPNGTTDIYWTATKRYKDNVYFVWIGRKKKDTDSTFDRMDSVLRDL